MDQQPIGNEPLQQLILAGASGESKKYYPVVIRPLEKLVGVEVRSQKRTIDANVQAIKWRQSVLQFF
jgi:hypothetical protein